MKKNRARNWWQPAVCGVAMLLGAALPAYGAVIAKYTNANVSVTLHDTPCQLKSQITNLPRRAVWTEDGKETEGCFGLVPQIGMVVLYFADRTAVPIPAPFFERMSET